MPNACRLITDTSEVNALLRRSDQACFWFTPFWTHLIGEVTAEPVEYRGCYRGHELVAACPLSVRRRLGFRLARRPFATPFAGIILSAALDDSEATAVSEQLLCHLGSQYDHVNVAQHPRFPPAVPFPPPWEERRKQTLYVPLDDPGEAWRRFDCEARNIVRKAERRGVRCSASSRTEAFFELYRVTFEAQGRPLDLNQARFTHLVDQLLHAKHGKLYLAETSAGDPAAGALVIYEPRLAHYFLAASHPARRSEGAPSALLWHIIQDAASRASTLDLGGANVASITQFKKQFGGAPVDYRVASRYRNSFARMQHWLYRHRPSQALRHLSRQRSPRRADS